MSRIKNFLYDNPNFCKNVKYDDPYRTICGSVWEQPEVYVPQRIEKPTIETHVEVKVDPQLRIEFMEFE